MDKHDEGEALSVTRCLPPQVTGWASHLSGSSSDTLITVLGMLPVFP